MLASAVQLLFVDELMYREALSDFRSQLIWPSLIFFTCAGLAVLIKGERRELT